MGFLGGDVRENRMIGASRCRRTSSLDSSASAASVRLRRKTYGEIVDGVMGR
jgi:hypothetical protein